MFFLVDTTPPAPPGRGGYPALIWKFLYYAEYNPLLGGGLAQRGRGLFPKLQTPNSKLQTFLYLILYRTFSYTVQKKENKNCVKDC